MKLELIETIKPALPYIFTAIAGIGGWYKEKIGTALGIKKKTKELDNQALDNVQKNLDIYQEMVDDIDTRYKQRIADIEESFQLSMKRLNEDLLTLQRLNAKFTKIIEEQKTIIAKQRKSLNYYEKKYGIEED